MCLFIALLDFSYNILLPERVPTCLRRNFVASTHFFFFFASRIFRKKEEVMRIAQTLFFFVQKSFKFQSTRRYKQINTNQAVHCM